MVFTGKLFKIFAIFISSFLLFFISYIEKPGKQHYRKINALMSSYRKKICKKYELNSVGDGGAMLYDIESVYLAFDTQRRCTLEEARELEIACVESLREEMNNHQELAPYLREHPVRPSQAEVSISFFDENRHYREDSSIARVFNAKDKLYYYSYDKEKDTTIEIFEEKYEDALNIVRSKKGNP